MTCTLAASKLLWCGMPCLVLARLAILTRPMRVIFQQQNEKIKEELCSKGQVSAACACCLEADCTAAGLAAASVLVC